MDKLLKYLNSLSKDARERFLTACGTTENYLRKAISINQRLRAGLCINIERESGRAVTCEDLLPDEDWAYLRNTPAKPNQTAISEALRKRNGGIRQHGDSRDAKNISK